MRQNTLCFLKQEPRARSYRQSIRAVTCHHNRNQNSIFNANVPCSGAAQRVDGSLDAPNLRWGRPRLPIQRSSATVSHLWLGRVSTPPTAARARSSSLDLDLSDRARRSHSAPCETAPARSSSNLAADPTSWSSTYSIQHSATTKKTPILQDCTMWRTFNFDQLHKFG